MANRLPNTIVIGAQKCGTTALYNWLSQHPDIFGEPAMKDFPFFCSDEHLNRGQVWFSKRFAGERGERVILHGYVHYLFLAERTAELFAQLPPETKLLAILRNPIDRAHSAFLQARKTGRESLKSFDAAVERELSKGIDNLESPEDQAYLAHGLYADQLANLLKFFPRNRIKVILFDDLEENPQRLCSDIFIFLGLSPDFSPTFKTINAFGIPRTQIVISLLSNRIITSFLKLFIPLNLRIRISQGLIQLNTKIVSKPAVSEEVRLRLSKYFNQDIENLELLLGRSLANWKKY